MRNRDGGNGVGNLDIFPNYGFQYNWDEFLSHDDLVSLL